MLSISTSGLGVAEQYQIELQARQAAVAACGRLQDNQVGDQGAVHARGPVVPGRPPHAVVYPDRRRDVGAGVPQPQNRCRTPHNPG